MSIVTMRNVEFINNTARFLDPYKFRVTFDSLSPLPDDIEWKLIYVSSPDDASLDQELDSCLVGPVPAGVNSFEFECSPPNPQLIPERDILGVAALIFTGSYAEQEFVRVGYYQNTEYEGGEEEKQKMEGKKVEVDRLLRDITKKPRVTRFQIKWDISTLQLTGATGAAASAAVPSADSYGGNEDDAGNKMDVDREVPVSSGSAAGSGSIPVTSS